MRRSPLKTYTNPWVCHPVLNAVVNKYSRDTPFFAVPVRGIYTGVKDTGIYYRSNDDRYPLAPLANQFREAFKGRSHRVLREENNCQLPIGFLL